MENNMELKALKNNFSKIFNVQYASFKDNETLSIKIPSNETLNAIDYLYNKESYKHLSMMSYIDKPKDNIIELIYILYSYTDHTTIILIIDLNRENPKFVTLKNIFPQAETFEIEFNEMMGIVFEGNNRMGEEFILEGWDGPPPMRKDFDTLEFVNDNYMFRSGRENSINVRDHIKNITGEKGALDD